MAMAGVLGASHGSIGSDHVDGPAQLAFGDLEVVNSDSKKQGLEHERVDRVIHHDENSQQGLAQSQVPRGAGFPYLS
jgi:hypothetical protein